MKQYLLRNTHNLEVATVYADSIQTERKSADGIWSYFTFKDSDGQPIASVWAISAEQAL